MAVEWDQPEYDAIVAATAAGRIVVEAAGNGNENIGDTADYGSPFPAGRADSGAIIVGAGGNNYDSGNCPGNTAHARLSFSTFGSARELPRLRRVHHHGGLRDLSTRRSRRQLRLPRHLRRHLRRASPMVAAAAGILSSVAIQRGDADGLTSVEARTAARNGATPQDTSSDTGNIGPMPNLRTALGAPTADAGGPYTGTEGTTVNLSATGSADQAPGDDHARTSGTSTTTVSTTTPQDRPPPSRGATTRSSRSASRSPTTTAWPRRTAAPSRSATSIPR